VEEIDGGQNLKRLQKPSAAGRTIATGRKADRHRFKLHPEALNRLIWQSIIMCPQQNNGSNVVIQN
jgi:hypothetical protein